MQNYNKNFISPNITTTLLHDKLSDEGAAVGLDMQNVHTGRGDLA